MDTKILCDHEIIELVQERPLPKSGIDDDDEDDEDKGKVVNIPHIRAEECFGTCIQRLEQQPEATPMNLLMLQKLQTMAAKSRAP
ncbi:UNVERIFIED_CONTAM: hypothetical protein FKN15_066959 [Acipenser sinensis]